MSYGFEVREIYKVNAMHDGLCNDQADSDMRWWVSLFVGYQI